ncbi:diacylglycerol/lipid kinase family protein [Hansschlegelia quercus]|uniref:DAGKc domain-containing protein n=1 Tax=Hansschlegelia quercus TaxID=2528245 RepID=A0A4Q9GU01_9HYPH|nr:diacylglycerol kinase family protein [Hansschlegelia quercus]TBN55307.1 hypothetical protein EYR15_00585 [Hansschlegelia quercus]
MKVALVLNASAGSLMGRPNAGDEIARKLSDAGMEVVAVLEGNSSDIVARMRRARDLPIDALITAGGDGTIAAGAEALLGTGIALGPLPLGTMNLLPKDLKIPLDIDAAIAALAGGETAKIDVAEVNGHVFLCNSMLGTPARLAERRERSRLKMGFWGWWRLVAAGIKGLYRYPPVRLGLELGGATIVLRSKAVVIANNAYDEGFAQVLTRSRLDRGELVVYATRRLSVWPLIRLSVRMALGRWMHDPDLETHTVGAVTVTSRRRLIRIMNDGETMLLKPPLAYRVLPLALTVLRPRNAARAPLESAA